MGKGSLVLDRWHVNFNPARERVQKRHLWALLPGLPFPLWNHPLLEGVGNTIGRFVVLDDDFMNSYDKRMAKISVELDISKRLPVEIEILCRERLFIQRLDYQGIPFRCSCCRETGHLRRVCPYFCNGSASLDH